MKGRSTRAQVEGGGGGLLQSFAEKSEITYKFFRVISALLGIDRSPDLN